MLALVDAGYCELKDLGTGETMGTAGNGCWRSFCACRRLPGEHWNQEAKQFSLAVSLHHPWLIKLNNITAGNEKKNCSTKIHFHRASKKVCLELSGNKSVTRWKSISGSSPFVSDTQDKKLPLYRFNFWLSFLITIHKKIDYCSIVRSLTCKASYRKNSMTVFDWVNAE